MSNCSIKNPLVRDGTSRTQRLLKALSPSYVLPDEHTFSDLINIAKRLALNIQCYNNDNQRDGDWLAFIGNDISTIVASISNTDSAKISDCFNTNINFINSSSTLNDNGRWAFDNIFRIIFFIADEINKWFINSVPGLRLNSELKQTVTAQLRDYLMDVIVYYKSALNSTKNLILKDNINVCTKVLFDGDILQSKFDIIWIIPGSAEKNWSDYINNINADDSLFKNNPESDINLIKNASEKLNQFFGKFYNAALRLVNNSPDYLEETLGNYPAHQPHIALFLAFIQLFKTAQNDLNKITGRHLDYYYKDVLQIINLDEVPDEVHLIFELAKQVDSYLLKEGTELKAGKDSAGKEVNYKTEEDTVLNKASVAQIKTVYVDYKDKGRVYSAPAANSKNGKGKAFDSDEPKWKTFGESQKNISPDKMTMEYAYIGFAISSPSLLLNEGERTVTVTLYVSGMQSDFNISTNNFKLYLTAKNKWIEPVLSTVKVNTSSGTIELKFGLSSDIDPVIDFNLSGLEGDFYPGFPVLKIILANDPSLTSEASNYVYALMQDLKLIKAEIQTEVNGVGNLILQNDAGLLKTGKPFYPFGNSPGIASNFYIGSRELFQKDLKDLKIHITWKDLPDKDLKDYYNNLITLGSTEDFKVNVSTLNDYSWNQLGTGTADNKKRNLFVAKNPADTSDNYKKIDIVFNDTDFGGYSSGLIDDVLTEYDVDTKRGFIKFRLSDPADAFGHSIYPGIYTKAIIQYATSGGTTNVVPNSPYTPFIDSLTVDYTSVQTIELPPSVNYDTGKGKFYLIYPFGIKEINGGTAHTDLLPQFSTEINTVKTHNEGELYIGIKDLNPSQTFSLLFQMAEGSADPKLPKQNVIWSYLSGNDWYEFDETEIISDATDGLDQIGNNTVQHPRKSR